MPLGHIGLTVTDVDEAIRWYTKVWGWQLQRVRSTYRPQPARHRSVAGRVRGGSRRVPQAHVVAPGGIAIELFEFRDRSRALAVPRLPPPGWSHVVIAPDIEAAVARISANGGRQRSDSARSSPISRTSSATARPVWKPDRVATPPHSQSFGGRRAY